MVKMRIPIREQLGCLVLLASLIGLAVIAVATWVTTHSFVLSIRATRLTLTAALKSAQLASNLLLMQSTVSQTGTRIAIQSALQRYNRGNNSAENWKRSMDDIAAVTTSDGRSFLIVQVQIFPVNTSAFSVLNGTSAELGSLQLPYTSPNGQPATLGADDYSGYIPELYPKFTTNETQYNETLNRTTANFQGRQIDSDNYYLAGPYRINSTFNLVSITMPIINNTSKIETLGWLTAVLDARLITDVTNALEGLDNTGVALLFGPKNLTNKFASGVALDPENRLEPIDPPDNELVHFVVPPTARNIASRHDPVDRDNDTTSFDWTEFPPIKAAFTKNTGASSNAGSMISTHNEGGRSVAVGYATVKSPMIDWAILIEQEHKEVWAPIYRLRNIIIACVFGTIGAMLILAFPVAHFSSRPIRRLRDAAKKSVAPPSLEGDDLGDARDGPDDHEDEMLARKEGWLAGLKTLGRRNKGKSAERREEERRRQFRIPAKVKDRKHFIHDELTDLTRTFNEMTDELMMQYEKLEERVAQRTAELEQSKKAAESANESKTLFIANISHELKTPLNGILGMCAVCMSEDDPIKLRRSLGIIYKSGDLLLNLLTDLLTFSKNQVGQHLSLDEKEFRLREISTQVLAIFERQAKEGEIDLAVKFEGPYDANLDDNGRPTERFDLGPLNLGRVKDMILYGDQHRILQVVINLVSNSLKFTPHGGKVTITIRCLGEASMTDSRKASLQSRQSSLRHSRTRGRASSSEVGSVTSPSNLDTANVINAMDKPIAFSHILANERAATPPPGRWLQFEFEVEDTGPGIPANLHDKIFEPFVQGDLGLSKKYGGTGLGLSICSQLAGLMKGTMSLRSELGHGSVFSMAIPLKHLTSRADSTASSSNINLGDMSARQSFALDEARARSPNDDARSIQSAVSNTPVTSGTAPGAGTGPVPFDADSKPRLVGLSTPFFASTAPLESPNSQTAAMERVTAEATKRGDKVKVLVAEDNKTNQEVVLRMLKLEDVYDVTVAKDGQEALDKVKESMERQTPYNLIFMDVQMPNLDGLQSTRLIRQSGFSAPIVALTAYAEESNVKECYDSGMDFFLSKPIRRPQLKQVLKTYCPPIPEEEGEATTPPASTATSNRTNGHPTRSNPTPAGGVNTASAPVTIAVPTADSRDSDNVSPLS
ncbi:putative histidine kinase HHK5p [Polyplosphaeria fusca]|uniref:histidine kinase n=1 Tax=Polyplosphaeria fusca TaxID=682080 RepID=A0A9P4QQP0_9PLEO|nr:putative histidine kinase HHK5p [Polyplosphaeria fusca]